MKIDWEQDACLTPVTEESYSSLLLLVADCCAVVEGIPLPSAAHVLLTDDAHIRNVNLTYRDIDRATDVLSFPTISYTPGHTARRSPRSLKREYDPELSACFLGDILISRDRASAQAAEYGHSLRPRALLPARAWHFSPFRIRSYRTRGSKGDANHGRKSVGTGRRVP